MDLLLRNDNNNGDALRFASINRLSIVIYSSIRFCLLPIIPPINMLSRNRFLHPPSLSTSCKCSRGSNRTLSVKVQCMQQQHTVSHIVAHCFSLNQLHGSAPVRCYLPTVSARFAFAFACVFRSASRTFVPACTYK